MAKFGDGACLISRKCVGSNPTGRTGGITQSGKSVTLIMWKSWVQIPLSLLSIKIDGLINARLVSTV